MSISSVNSRNDYIGNNTTAIFSYNFKIFKNTELKVFKKDILSGAETLLALTTDYTVAGVGVGLGGTITLVAGNLPTGETLTIKRNVALDQKTDIRNQGEFFPEIHENAFDKLTMISQQLQEQADRSIRVSDGTDRSFVSAIVNPPPLGVIGINEDSTGIKVFEAGEFEGPQGIQGEQGETGVFVSMDVVAELEYEDLAPMSVTNVGTPELAELEFILRKGPKGESTVLITTAATAPDDMIGANGDMWFVFLPGDPLNGDVYQKVLGTYVLRGNIQGPAGGVTDIDLTVGSYLTTYDGFSARFGAQFTSTSLKDTLDKIIQITYTPPQISLGGSSNILREKGDTVSSITLTASVTKKSDPIAEVRFYQGATLLGTKTGTMAGGGTETQGYGIPFSDNITFSAKADDNGATGGPTTVTANASYTFIYPYYNGAGASGKSAAQVAALSKSIINSTATLAKTMSAAASDVFYFAYPASYGALTSILDVNNFETIGDWTLTTSNITGLNATPVSYRIYEFKNPVTAGSYQYTFKR